MNTRAVILAGAVALAASASAVNADETPAEAVATQPATVAACGVPDCLVADLPKATSDHPHAAPSGIRRYGRVAWNVGEAWATGPLAANVSAFSDGRDALRAPQLQSTEMSDPRP